MTLTQQIITIGMVVLGTMLTRFLPFLLFPAGKPTPKYIQYLGKVLPASVFGLLVIYCLKMSVFYRQPRDTGTFGYYTGHCSAPLETADAVVHSGRHYILHDFSTDDFLTEGIGSSILLHPIL